MSLVLDALGKEEDVIELELVVLELLDLHDLVEATTIKAVELRLLDVLLQQVGSCSLCRSLQSSLSLLVLNDGAEWFENIAAELTAGPGLGEGGHVSLVVQVSLEVGEFVQHDSELVDLLFDRGSVVSAGLSHLFCKI